MVLHEPGEPIKFGYFLNSGLASVLTVLTEGKSVEVGLTGKEGFVGLPLIVGFSTSPTRTVIQIDATGFRINAKNLVQALRQSPGLMNRLQRYVQILGMQGTQVAACNRLHEVDERLARWLLMCQDRIGSNFVASDPGISGTHAGHPPSQCHGGCRHPAEGRPDYLPARTCQHRRPAPAGNGLLRMLRNDAAAETRNGGAKRADGSIE